MPEPFVVEIWGKPAGVVLKEGNAFRFHAFTRPFFELEGHQFSTPGRRSSPRRSSIRRAKACARNSVFRLVGCLTGR